MSPSDPSPAPLDEDACHRAITARDTRFDGRFYTCVHSTGIYCRPICPAPTPRREHCSFVRSAAAAHAAGFRPCLRCRPEVAPGLAGWRGTASTVSRALGLIAEGALDDGSCEDLAARLGVGPRHLRRLFRTHVGASPVAVAQAQRVLFAKKLVTETRMPLTDVALAAGFGSVRRFNEVMKTTWGRPPSALRRASGPEEASLPTTGVTLTLGFTQPYDWTALLAFFEARAAPGVEAVAGGRYRRTLALGSVTGLVDVGPATRGDALEARVWLTDVDRLATVATRLRRLFDLDADVDAIAQVLGQDPVLAPSVRAHPGLRVPGAWDAFELAVRAILGQQVSVAGARTLAGRLVERCGTPVSLPEAAPGEGLTHTFPTPQDLASADLDGLGLPGARARALTALARAVIADPDLLRPRATLDEAVTALCALPGIGPWTARYIAMRGLGEPDAFIASDLGVRRALSVDEIRPGAREVEARATAWRPWRAYAVLHLWNGESP